MSYITEKERYHIEAWLKEGLNSVQIAKHLNKTPAAVRREIKRGMVTLISSELMEYETYCPDTAQARYEQKKKNKGCKPKIKDAPDLADFIERKIVNEKFSPAATANYIKKHHLQFSTSICIKTIYNYIDKGIIGNLTNAHLHIKKNQKPEKNKTELPRKKVVPERKSIEERSESINDRTEVNHHEMDCVLSGQTDKAALLVITERLSRKSIIRKMTAKTQAEVIRILDELEKENPKHFSECFQTITMDNGVEFLDFKSIERSVLNENKKRTATFYCHPYSAYERGSNENVNRLIRYWVPKSSRISELTDEFIQFVEDWVNNYPRKIFDWYSSNEVYEAVTKGCILSNS